jgi:hypothetical protein
VYFNPNNNIYTLFENNKYSFYCIDQFYFLYDDCFLAGYFLSDLSHAGILNNSGDFIVMVKKPMLMGFAVIWTVIAYLIEPILSIVVLIISISILDM